MGNTRKLAPITMSLPVITAINEELAYQATLPDSGRADAKDHGVSGQLVTMERYLRKANDAWTDNPGEEAALDVMRKLAAIAVRALETYGCPRRK